MQSQPQIEPQNGVSARGSGTPDHPGDPRGRATSLRLGGSPAAGDCARHRRPALRRRAAARRSADQRASAHRRGPRDYVVDPIGATRDPGAYGVRVAQYIQYGASPRAAVVGTQDCNPERGPSGSYCCLQKASVADAATDGGGADADACAPSGCTGSCLNQRGPPRQSNEARVGRKPKTPGLLRLVREGHAGWRSRWQRQDRRGARDEDKRAAPRPDS